MSLATAAQAARFGTGQVNVPANVQGRAMLVQQAQAQAQAQVAQAQAQAQVAQAQAQAQALAAGTAPALQAHLSPTYNAARLASASPGVTQQSPPHQQALVQNPVTSPRPPSAQAQVTAIASPTATAARTVQPVAHYYTGATAPTINAQNFDPNHLRQIIIQQACNTSCSGVSER